MVSESILEFDGVSFAYGEHRRVLDGLSLSLAAGERIGLRGDNGSGKTTLLHLAVGLLRPASGEVRAFGAARRTERDFHEVRRRIGLLFQDPEDQLFCPTVGEDVAFGPLNLGQTPRQARDTARQALANVGLEGFEDRITHHLSGGEKRLASIAGVLAMQPDALLLDEPLEALDEHARERVAELLDRLPQAMIVVSHDPDFLARHTSRSVELRAGRVRENDTGKDE